MKKLDVIFEKSPLLKYIEVVFRASEKDNQVEELMDMVLNHKLEKLTFLDLENTVRVIPLSDIVSITVEKKFAAITTLSEKFFSKQTLQGIEKSLYGANFVRISRHEIINIAKVEKYDFSVGGTLRILLSNGDETWASRRCIPQIRRLLLGKE